MKYCAHHYCIKVPDYKEARDFYIKALNFKEKRIIEYPGTGRTSCFLEEPNSGMLLQILETDEYCKEERCQDGSCGHFGIHTDDIAESYRFHQDLGCVIRPWLEERSGITYSIQDPFFNEIEIISVNSEALQE